MIKVTLPNVIIIALIAIVAIIVAKYISIRYPIPEPIKNLVLSV